MRHLLLLAAVVVTLAVALALFLLREDAEAPTSPGAAFGLLLRLGSMPLVGF